MDLIRPNLCKAARVVALVLDDSEASDRDRLVAAGIAYKVAGSFMAGIEVRTVQEPQTLDQLAVEIAGRAHSMAAGFFLSMEDTRPAIQVSLAGA